MTNDEPTQAGEVTVADLDRLIAELKAQRVKCDELAALAAPENKKLARLETQIAEALKALDRDNYATPEGTFYFIRQWRFSLPPEGNERQAFIEWLRQKGIAEKYLTVNSQSYNSLMKQEREAAQREGRFMDVPGVGEPALFETVGFRAKK